MFDRSNVESFEEELSMAHDQESTESDRIQKSIDVKYKEADFPAVIGEAKDLYQKE